MSSDSPIMSGLVPQRPTYLRDPNAPPSPTTTNGESSVSTESSARSSSSQMTNSMSGSQPLYVPRTPQPSVLSPPPAAAMQQPPAIPTPPAADTTSVTSSTGSLVNNQGGVTGAGIGLFTTLLTSPGAVSLQSQHSEVSSIGSSLGREGDVGSVGSDAPVLPLILKSRGRRVRRGPGGTTTSASSQSPAANAGPPTVLTMGRAPASSLMVPPPPLHPPPVAGGGDLTVQQVQERSQSPLVGFNDRASLEDVPPFRLPSLHSAPINAQGQPVPTQELRVLRCPHTPGELSLSSMGSLLEDSIEYNPNTSPEIDSALSTVGYPPYMAPSSVSSQGSRGTGGDGIRPTNLFPMGSRGVPPLATPPSIVTAGGFMPEPTILSPTILSPTTTFSPTSRGASMEFSASGGGVSPTPALLAESTDHDREQTSDTNEPRRREASPPQPHSLQVPPPSAPEPSPPHNRVVSSNALTAFSRGLE